MNEYQMLKSLRKITKRWMEKLNSIPAKRIELEKDNDMKFKVGDRVKLVYEGLLGYELGSTGTIDRIDETSIPCRVKMDNPENKSAFLWSDEKGLELLEKENETELKEVESVVSICQKADTVEEGYEAVKNAYGKPIEDIPLTREETSVILHDGFIKSLEGYKELKLKGEDKESYTVTATIGISDPYEPITVTASGAPRPEGEGDVFCRGEKVGTFTQKNGEHPRVKFDKPFSCISVSDLVLVKTVPFDGIPTLEIGNEKKFGVGGNIISGGVATEEDMIRDGKKAIERLGKYINATQEEHNPFEDYAEWLRSGGDVLTFTKRDYNNLVFESKNKHCSFVIYERENDLYKSEMRCYNNNILKYVYYCKEVHSCSCHNHYDYFKPIAENWYRHYMLEKLTGVKLDD